MNTYKFLEPFHIATIWKCNHFSPSYSFFFLNFTKALVSDWTFKKLVLHRKIQRHWSRDWCTISYNPHTAGSWIRGSLLLRSPTHKNSTHPNVVKRQPEEGSSPLFHSNHEARPRLPRKTPEGVRGHPFPLEMGAWGPQSGPTWETAMFLRPLRKKIPKIPSALHLESSVPVREPSRCCSCWPELAIN